MNVVTLEQLRREKIKASCITCSIDKDLDTFAGWHYNWRKDKLYFVSQLEANMNFYCQALMGDATDNIKGLKGIGPKKAEKWMAECKPMFGDEPGCYELYHHALRLCFDRQPQEKEELVEDWIDRVSEAFELTAKLVWIQRIKYVVWQPPVHPDEYKEEVS